MKNRSNSVCWNGINFDLSLDNTFLILCNLSSHANSPYIIVESVSSVLWRLISNLYYTAVAASGPNTEIFQIDWVHKQSDVFHNCQKIVNMCYEQS